MACVSRRTSEGENDERTDRTDKQSPDDPLEAAYGRFRAGSRLLPLFGGRSAGLGQRTADGLDRGGRRVHQSVGGQRVVRSALRGEFAVRLRYRARPETSTIWLGRRWKDHLRTGRFRLAAVARRALWQEQPAKSA